MRVHITNGGKDLEKKIDEKVYETCEQILSNDKKYNYLQEECNSAYKTVLKNLTDFSNKTCELMEYSHKLLINKIASDLNK